MNTTMNSLQRAPGTFALALLVLPLRFDDPAKPQGKPTLPIPIVGGQGESDPHVEMAKLFGKIELDLRQIDKLLNDASAGGASTKEAEERAQQAIAGIDELLKSSEERSRAVVDGIDKLFELANHAHAPGGT